MLRSWRLAALALAFAVVIPAALLRDGSTVFAAVEFVVFLALAVVLSPLPFPRAVSAAQARAAAARDGRPIVYWRPGCRYCLRLRTRLGRDARLAYWVNIWGDPDGAAAVRAVTGGSETVPTVVVADESFVNPDPGWLRDRLAAFRKRP